MGHPVTLAAVEFEPVANAIVTQLGGDRRLEALDLLGSESRNLARLDVDQMIVMDHVRCFEPGGRALESMSLNHALLLEHGQGSIDVGQ